MRSTSETKCQVKRIILIRPDRLARVKSRSARTHADVDEICGCDYTSISIIIIYARWLRTRAFGRKIIIYKFVLLRGRERTAKKCVQHNIVIATTENKSNDLLLLLSYRV